MLRFSQTILADAPAATSLTLTDYVQAVISRAPAATTTPKQAAALVSLPWPTSMEEDATVQTDSGCSETDSVSPAPPGVSSAQAPEITSALDAPTA